MKILLVSATRAEIAPAISYLNSNAKTISFSQYEYKGMTLFPLVSGIGSTMMAFALARFKGLQNFDLIIHAGISGSYHPHINIGSMVEVVSEQWGDLGAEKADGDFLNIFEMDLMDPNRFPYHKSVLLNSKHVTQTGFLPVKGLTVNRTSGSKNTISRLKEKFECDVESMEGAGMFYAAKILDIPFVSLRCISNFVEPRDKSKWKIPEAIEILNENIITYLNKL